MAEGGLVDEARVLAGVELVAVHHEARVQRVPDHARDGVLRPTQPPLRREAATLSRVRSATMLRSNSANDINMLSVSRPIASAVEKSV